MKEELLYLSLLINRPRDQYILILARDLVCDKYPHKTQIIQESFEEIAALLRHNLPLPLSANNEFSYIGTQWRLLYHY